MPSFDAVPIINSLRGSRSRWRIIAFLALAAMMIAMTLRITSENRVVGGDYVARVVIEGGITTNPARLAILERLVHDERVKAVIVRINSPGGSTAGGEELYEVISRIRANKPVVAFINELGASAAYMTAIASDYIVARRLSLVGSIGVLYQHLDAGGLFETIGIDLDKIASGPLKAEPDFDEPISDEVRVSLQALVDDSFDWFVDIVAERRSLSRTATLALSDGRIMNGRVALEAGLIDAFGGELEARNWLDGRDIDPDLEIYTAYPLPEGDLDRFLRLLGSQARAAIGLDTQSLAALDGLVSVWHVSL